MKVITEDYSRKIKRVLHLRKFKAIEQFRQLVKHFDETPDEEGKTEHVPSSELASHLPQVYGNTAETYIDINQKNIILPMNLDYIEHLQQSTAAEPQDKTANENIEATSKSGHRKDGRTNEGGKKKRRGFQTNGEKQQQNELDRKKAQLDEKDMAPLPIQEQIVEVDINVKKINLPQNHTVYLVEKLRNINKYMKQLRDLKKLKSDVRSQRQTLTKVINKNKEKRLQSTSIRRYQLQKMGILKNPISSQINKQSKAKNPEDAGIRQIKQVQDELQSLPNLHEYLNKFNKLVDQEHERNDKQTYQNEKAQELKGFENR